MGTIKPTKPIDPLTAVAAPVTRAVRTRIKRRVRTTGTPTARLFFTEQQGIETTVEAEEAGNADGDRGGGDQDMLPGLVPDASDQPEQQLLHPVHVGQDHHEGDAGGGHAPHGDPGQEQRVTGGAAAEIGQRVDQEASREAPEKGTDRQRQEYGLRQAGVDGEHGTERSAPGHAEDARVGQGVLEGRLQRRPGARRRGADQAEQEDLRQAHLQHQEAFGGRNRTVIADPTTTSGPG